MSALLIAGCDNGNGLPHINEAFSKSWEQIARKDPDYIVNDISHMKKQEENLMEQETPEIASAPIGDVTAEPVQIADASPNMDKPSTPPMPTTPYKNPNVLSYNPKNIFGKPMNSDAERLDRLERAVQDMRNDFNLVEPSIRRLMSIENEMQKLVGELQKLNANSSTASSIANKGKPKPLRPKPNTTRASNSGSSKSGFVKKSAPPVGAQPSVFDLRVGEHSDKTRIVMDVNTKTSFNVDIDNGERIMVIDMPNTVWNARTSQNFTKSPYISSYKVESADNGNIVVFQLKKDAKIGYKGDLKGFEGSSRRIVIDVTN